MSNFTTELILDDVIINAVPEPGSLMLLAIALGSGPLFVRGRRMSRRPVDTGGFIPHNGRATNRNSQ